MIATAGWKRAVLPAEHGVWGLLAGAALVGLPLGRDPAGLGLLVAAIAAIVIRQAVSVRSRAIAVAAAGLAGAGVAATWVQGGGRNWLPWALAAALVAAAQLGSGRPGGRPWGRSALAGIAFALLAAAVAVAGGASTGPAAIAAGALGGHFVAIVPLVRSQTRPDQRWPELALELHLLLLLLAVAGWAAHLLPAGLPLLAGLGLARCCFLADKKVMMSAHGAAVVGRREMAWLPVVALGVILSVRGGLS